MKVFLDTNIVIDFYDQRGDFYYPAAVIFDLAHKRKIQLYVSAIKFVNSFFISIQPSGRGGLVYACIRISPPHS